MAKRCCSSCWTATWPERKSPAMAGLFRGDGGSVVQFRACVSNSDMAMKNDPPKLNRRSSEDYGSAPNSACPPIWRHFHGCQLHVGMLVEQLEKADTPVTTRRYDLEHVL